ncbi:MAG: ribonuclease HII [Rhodothermales bacterium]|nr:ribonuclease HII [Rhodothermales bacterium]
MPERASDAQQRKEREAISPSLDIEKIYWRQGWSRVAGADEAGRGCLAGPVVAAAVVFPPDVYLQGVRDSKTMPAEQRERMAIDIRREAVAVGIGICSPEEIDHLNILWASLEAMRRATVNLMIDPDIVLIDGNRSFPNPAWPTRTIVKGDALSHSIAAASIIAKTVRDGLMRDLDATHPEYGWARNAGYPTPAHYRALATHGPTTYHRRTFRLTPVRIP